MGTVDLQSLLSVCCLFILDQKSPYKDWKVNIYFNFVAPPVEELQDPSKKGKYTIMKQIL